MNVFVRKNVCLVVKIFMYSMLAIHSDLMVIFSEIGQANFYAQCGSYKPFLTYSITFLVLNSKFIRNGISFVVYPSLNRK